MATKCDVCGKSFKNSHGISVHKIRTDCGGSTPSSRLATRKAPKSNGKRPTNNKGENGRQAIHRILGDHPQGLPVTKIFEELKKDGLTYHQHYVSQAAASDPTIVRIGRGVYRLKNNVRQSSVKQNGITTVQEATIEVQPGPPDMPREALLLRIETLETQNRALHDAHLSLMRGIFV